MSRPINTLLASAVLATACAPVGPSYDEATLAIVDANVIPMTDETVLADHMVVVAGERILAVEPTDRGRLPEGAQVVEANGAYLTPGLWDMHVHVASDPDDALERTLPLFVANGITGVRDMGAELDGLTEVRRRLAAEPDLTAPRLYAGGPLLDGMRKPWYGDLPLILEGPERVPAELARLQEAGVDFFKVYDDLSPSTFEAIARFANEAGVPFAGHVPSRVTVAEAARAGMRSIEHLNLWTGKDCVDEPGTWFNRWISAKFGEGYDAYYGVIRDFWAEAERYLCDAAFDAMAEQGTFFTPTLDMELNDRTRLDTADVKFMLPQSQGWCETVLGGVGSADPALREAAFDLQLSVLRRMRDAGVTVLAGSDTPNNCVAPGFSLHWELALLTEAGMTPFEALAAATVDAASALGLEDRAGQIVAGNDADLVLFEANPLDDIFNTRKIAGVVTAGQWYDASALDGMKAQALAVVERVAAEAESD